MKKTTLFILSVLTILSFGGCGQKTSSVNLTNAMESIKAQVNMDEMIELSADDLAANYGIEVTDVKQFAIIADTTGIKADEIVLIEGTNSDAAKRIKEKLDVRYEQKCTENIDYLPEQYAIIKKCNVKQNGNYVSMIISPDATKLEKLYNESFK